MLGRGGILLCPRGFPAVTVRLKLRDGAAKSPCTCGLDSEIYNSVYIQINALVGGLGTAVDVEMPVQKGCVAGSNEG